MPHQHHHREVEEEHQREHRGEKDPYRTSIHPGGVFGELRKVVNKPKEVPHLDKPEAQAKEAEDHRPVDGQGEDERDTEGSEPPRCRHRPEEE